MSNDLDNDRHANEALADDESASLLDHALHKEDERYSLLDASLENIGFGAFQIRVIVLTGFGTFVDALEASLLSMLYPVFLANKFASGYIDLAMVSSLQAAGMLLGSMFLGILSDRIGRRLVYLITLFMVVLFGLISSFAGDITAFAILRFILGFGYGGNNNTSTSLMLELMPNNKRGSGSAFHGLSWGLGSLIIAAVAWGGGDNLNWRWLVRVPSLIAVPVLIAVFWLPESPRFYVHMDDNENLHKSIKAIADANGVQLPSEASMTELNAARERSKNRALTTKEDGFLIKLCSSLSHLCTSRAYLRLILPLCTVWLMQGIGGTVITWLPLQSTILTKTQNTGNHTSVYVTAFVSAAGIVVAATTGFCTGSHVRRQYLIRAGLISTIAFVLGVAFTQTVDALYALSFFICASVQIVNGALYLYAPEVLPTNIRSTGFGICLALFRVGSVFAPFVAAVLTDANSFQLTSCAFAAFFLLALIASFCTNSNTVNVPMKERADML